MAYYYSLSGQPERAEKYLLDSIALFPKKPSDAILMNMCRVQLMLHKYDSAVQWCLKFQDANPQWSAQSFLLGMAYMMSGNVTAAKAIVAEKLRENPKFSISQDIKETAEQSTIASFPDFARWYKSEVVPAMRLAGVPE